MVCAERAAVSTTPENECGNNQERYADAMREDMWKMEDGCAENIYQVISHIRGNIARRSFVRFRTRRQMQRTAQEDD
jgi:hypothetical protein